jgi:hypothetical protein
LQDIQNDITKLKHYAFYVYIRSRNKTTKKSVEAELRGIKPKRLNGTNRLHEIERTIVTNNIEELTLKKLNFEQFPAKFWWLILIIAGVI